MAGVEGMFGAMLMLMMVLMTVQCCLLVTLVLLACRPFVNREMLNVLREIKSSSWRLETHNYYSYGKTAQKGEKETAQNEEPELKKNM